MSHSIFIHTPLCKVLRFDKSMEGYVWQDILHLGPRGSNSTLHTAGKDMSTTKSLYTAEKGKFPTSFP